MLHIVKVRDIFHYYSTLVLLMMIKFATDTEARVLLKDGKFQEEWNKLYEVCPWATPFQSVGYVTTWYEIYRERYHPVIVSQVSSDGKISGLLILALSVDSKCLIVAGAPQAEYQAWLASPQYGNIFIEHALKEIRVHFPKHSLTFKYLPPSTPLDWTVSNQSYGQLCKLEVYPHPLMRLTNGDQLSAPLRSKHAKRKLRTLKKSGKISNDHIEDINVFISVFDEIMTFYDARQIAMNNVSPFQDDPLKRLFHIALLKVPGLLHVFILRLDNNMIAAHLGLPSGDMLIPILFVYNPFYAKCSPGQVHLFVMGQELIKQGFSFLDLTPGGDPWKERFATDWDEVHELTIFSNHRKVIQCEVRQEVNIFAKRVLQLCRIRPQLCKSFLTKLRDIRISHVFSLFKRLKRLRSRPEVRVYVMNSEEVAKLKNPQIMSRDRIEDLLLFQTMESWQPSRQSFMAEAFRRIEQGEHVYTYIEQGQLLHFGWLKERQKTIFFSEVEREYQLPPDSVTLYDFYTVPQARGRGLYQSALRQLLHEAIAIPGTKQVYIGVVAGNKPSQQVIEKIGFTYECSLFKK